MRILQVVLMLSLLSCATSKDQKEKPKTLDEYFKKEFPDDEPGAAVLIMKGDSIVFAKGYGLADLNTKEPITTKTLFNLGSISKTFVANAILILQEQGKLSIDDSLIKYFPAFKNKQIAEKVKIKHLLTHTSGLPDNRQVSKDTTFYLTARDEENWAPVMQTEKLNFEPGSKYEYSNPAFNGLALIVEQVSEMKWQVFVEQNIMKPSGMPSSTITDGPHPESGVSHGYVKNRGEWIEDDYGEEPTFPAAGNGGVWSSVEELAKYELAIKQGKFLRAETIKESRTIKRFENWNDNEPPFIGWSWFIEKTSTGLQTIGHSGSQGGFLTNYVTIPEKDIFFVILCNTPRDSYGLSKYTQKILEWLSEEGELQEGNALK